MLQILRCLRVTKPGRCHPEQLNSLAINRHYNNTKKRICKLSRIIASYSVEGYDRFVILNGVKDLLPTENSKS